MKKKKKRMITHSLAQLHTLHAAIQQSTERFAALGSLVVRLLQRKEARNDKGPEKR